MNTPGAHGAFVGSSALRQIDEYVARAVLAEGILAKLAHYLNVECKDRSDLSKERVRMILRGEV